MGESHVPGLELSERFYFEVVRPLLDRSFPMLPHAAALVGSGSEVLGFDDELSVDHHYGPRVMLFLREADHSVSCDSISAMLAERLPYSFRGYSTNFSEPDPNDSGVQHLRPIESGPVNHRVEILTVRGFFLDYLGVDPNAPLEPADWLTLPQQRLRAAVGGAVYHDEVGLEQARERLGWYPHDVWLYLLAAGWARIGQEEHLMGRAGSSCDEVGSALLGARLVRDVMRLCFLMERTYAPYPKWFGTAFKQLSCGPALMPTLEGALHAAAWQERERHLVVAYETLARMHNRLGVTDPMPEQTRLFYGRPFRVMALHGFSDVLLREVTDARVREIARRPTIGNLDMVSDNTDLLEPGVWRSKLRSLYE